MYIQYTHTRVKRVDKTMMKMKLQLVFLHQTVSPETVESKIRLSFFYFSMSRIEADMYLKLMKMMIRSEI